ncbi:MAG: BON domain-containing protein [Rhizobacter sp.]|nr:BON domain-containing protein [Rhizobacter sp.]
MALQGPRQTAAEEMSMHANTQTVRHLATFQPMPAASLRQYEGSDSVPCPGNAELCLDVRLALLRVCPSIAFAIDIVALDGVVHLRGSVGSERQLVQMYKAARTVPGIQWVCNDVTVERPPQQLRFEFDTLSGLAAAA